MKMISSKNEFALESAVNQLEGRVSGFIENIRQEILHHMGYIEAALDDPEHYDLGNFSFKKELVMYSSSFFNPSPVLLENEIHSHSSLFFISSSSMHIQ